MHSNYNLEKKSCAVSLSDMEIFVFPDLMFSLVLANIMSPRIWKWLDDPWFKDIDKYKPYKKIQRLRQFIMDNYTFNLDLDTWGLTQKDKEIDRFKDFIDIDILRKSNALFGYEGDKYYFDMDIRRHFGLDKYTTDTIPYWKTETVEAMDAFKYKDGYSTGAGECVSLGSLWAAALFIICKIPLEDIYLMATPLHSQNYVMVRDGVITNNRRIVTRNMWVNGTELSAKARRAMENEQVTIISHISGHIHVMYDDCSIEKDAYYRFSEEVERFLHFKLDPDILCNFLRYHSKLQKCFQYEYEINGNKCYIGMDRLFAYEHNSPYQLVGPSRKKLLEEIDDQEFHSSPMEGRLTYNTIDELVKKRPLSLDSFADMELLRNNLGGCCFDVHTVIENLKNFCITIPRLPKFDQKEHKLYSDQLSIKQGMNRNDIIKYLDSMRAFNPIADYAFYAYRDLNKTEAQPFIKAATERNPACIEGYSELEITEILNLINSYENESIYDEDARLAQPDEVFNYKRGDGAEKAILLANVLKAREAKEIIISIENNSIKLSSSLLNTEFNSSKNLNNQSWEV